MESHRRSVGLVAFYEEHNEFVRSSRGKDTVKKLFFTFALVFSVAMLTVLSIAYVDSTKLKNEKDFNDVISIGSVQEETKPFRGNWKIRWPCTGEETGVYAQRCSEGIEDYFEIINLTQSSNKLCGFHIATAHKHNRIDEGDLSGSGPSIWGTLTGNYAEVQFRSRTGGIGNAVMRVEGKKLFWEVTKRAEGGEFIPLNAILIHEDTDFQSTACNAE